MVSRLLQQIDLDPYRLTKARHVHAEIVIWEPPSCRILSCEVWPLCSLQDGQSSVLG